MRLKNINPIHNPQGPYMNIAQKILIIAAFGLVMPVAQAADSVATVNGKPIKQSLMDYIVKDSSGVTRPSVQISKINLS